MIVTELKTWVVGNPPPHFGGRYFIFVKLTTNTGICGYGEIYAASFSPHVVCEMATDVFQMHVEGMNPLRIEHLWRNVYSRGYSGRPDISLVGVLSGLEMALWDINGKALDQPIHELLGGRVHDKLRSYTYIYPQTGGANDRDNAAYTDPDAAAQRALTYADMGFTALKFDPAGPYTAYDPRQPDLHSLERSADFCRALRDAVGNRCDLLFGTHGQFTTAGAIRMARRLEPFDPLWFEEPVPPETPEEMARVARQTTIPIATGERLTTKYEFKRVLEQQAASILQMALGRVGGLLEAKKIAGMAEAYYAQIAPHLYCGPIEGAANAQLAACSPNFLILESIENWQGFHAQILTTPMRWEDGYLLVPDTPGLGVELNEAVADAHPYTGADLHICPLPTPWKQPT